MTLTSLPIRARRVSFVRGEMRRNRPLPLGNRTSICYKTGNWPFHENQEGRKPTNMLHFDQSLGNHAKIAFQIKGIQRACPDSCR